MNGPNSLPRKPAVMKGLELFPFADIKPLADVDERRHRRIQRPQGPGDHGRPMCGAATVCGGA